MRRFRRYTVILWAYTLLISPIIIATADITGRLVAIALPGWRMGVAVGVGIALALTAGGFAEAAVRVIDADLRAWGRIMRGRP